MTDPAEIRAEGRRLLALEADADSDGSRANVAGALYAHLLLHADVLLAGPAPVGLTEDDRSLLHRWRSSPIYKGHIDAVGDLIDRLSAAPVDNREREGEVLLDAPTVKVFKAGTLWGWGCASCRESDGTYEMRAHAAQAARSHRCLAPVSPSVDPEEGT